MDNAKTPQGAMKEAESASEIRQVLEALEKRVMTEATRASHWEERARKAETRVLAQQSMGRLTPDPAPVLPIGFDRTRAAAAETQMDLRSPPLGDLPSRSDTPGVQTTEFWTTLIQVASGQIITALIIWAVITGRIEADSLDVIVAAIGVLGGQVGAAWSGVRYNQSRQSIKVASTEAMALKRA